MVCTRFVILRIGIAMNATVYIGKPIAEVCTNFLAMLTMVGVKKNGRDRMK